MAWSVSFITLVARLNLISATALKVTIATRVPCGFVDTPNVLMIVCTNSIPRRKFVFPTLAELSRTNTKSSPEAPEDIPALARLSTVTKPNLLTMFLRKLSATSLSSDAGSMKTNIENFTLKCRHKLEPTNSDIAFKFQAHAQMCVNDRKCLPKQYKTNKKTTERTR